MTSTAVAAVTTSLKNHEEQKLQQRARDVHAKWVTETSTWKFPCLWFCPARGAEFIIPLDTEYETQPVKITPRQFSFCASNGILVCPGPRGRVRLGVALNVPGADLVQKCQILKEVLENLRLYGDVEGPEKAKVAY